MSDTTQKLDARARRAVIDRLLRDARPYRTRLVFALVLGLFAGLGPLALSNAFPLVINGVIGNPKHPSASSRS